jgi:hypothetical protein
MFQLRGLPAKHSCEDIEYRRADSISSSPVIDRGQGAIVGILRINSIRAASISLMLFLGSAGVVD